MKNKTISILGTRGIPARYGGFETFAEVLAQHLQQRGWGVRVYCQAEGAKAITESQWNGIQLVHVPCRLRGPAGTVEFDWRCTWHAIRHPAAVNLTLGYNTAIFSVLYRLLGRVNVFNMDGLEWKRSKWSLPIRVWFYINEWLGCWLGNRLIADHPEIARHLASRGVASKVTTIPYGAEPVLEASKDVLQTNGLEAERYLLLVARPEPENSILELVQAFSARRRGYKLVVLGTYSQAHYPYHDQVIKAASDEVMFLGAIYDQSIVSALRCHARAYLHGHQVGGTNPSLVEALGAGCAVLAHDNPFTRWVAADGALYFSGAENCLQAMDQLLSPDAPLEHLRAASRERHAALFTWPDVLNSYENLLLETCGLPVANNVGREHTAS